MVWKYNFPQTNVIKKEKVHVMLKQIKKLQM